MELFIEIVKTILPAIVTGIFTFIITKYNYNKNIPLDNLKIAYNRVYYPIYKILSEDRSSNKEVEQNIIKITSYLKKYNKYVDRATLKSFKILTKSKTERDFENFKTNIYNKNSYLRRRLGYLEPNIFQMYIYSSKNQKSVFRILVDLLIIYISLIIANLAKGKIQMFFTLVAIILAIFFAIELIILLFRTIYKAIHSFFKR